MNMPEFTAQSSLYRTSNRYRSSGSELSGLPSTQSVVAAYHPGPSTRKRCDMCLQSCANAKNSCEDFVAGLVSWWNPVAALLLYAGCYSDAADCRDQCANPPLGACCPKACGPLNPFEPGAGCCDGNEQCVDRYDPNSRQGCCPSGQSVCGGKCCAQGESCCGDTCCPSTYYCLDGNFCSQYPSNVPFGNPPPPPPPDNNCIFGGAPCGNKCCPPGWECCGVFNGQPDCKTSCLH
jgi:hypothetical protein